MTQVNGVRLMEQRHYELTIANGAVLPVSEYRPTERHFRVEYVILNYRRHDGGVWSLDTPKLGGTVLRKDGGDSKNRTSRSASWKSDEWPTWLHELTAAYSPVATTPPAPESAEAALARALVVADDLRDAREGLQPGSMARVGLDVAETRLRAALGQAEVSA